MDSQEIIKNAFDALITEKAKITEQSAPIRAQRDALMAQIQALEAQAKELADQYKAIEAPLFDLDNQIAGIAKTLGAKTLSGG